MSPVLQLIRSTRTVAAFCLILAGCAYPMAVTVGRNPVSYTPPPPGAVPGAVPVPVVTPPPRPSPIARPAPAASVAPMGADAGPAPVVQPKPPLVVPVYTAPVYGTAGPTPGG